MKELIFLILLFILFVTSFFITKEITFIEKIDFSKDTHEKVKYDSRIVSLLPLKNELTYNLNKSDIELESS